MELTVFADFVRLSQLPISLATVEKRKPPEPDLLCVHASEGTVAFELVELCDPNVARAFAMPHRNEAGVEYIRTSDPSSRILKKKLRKSYDTEHVNDLSCYTAGRIITPSDVTAYHRSTPQLVSPHLSPRLADVRTAGLRSVALKRNPATRGRRAPNRLSVAHRSLTSCSFP